MNQQQNKENFFFGPNIITIKPLKPPKHKSLETKINKKPFLNLQFTSDLNSNQKIKNIFTQEAHTPEFGFNRKNTFLIKPLAKNRKSIRLKQNQKSFDLELNNHSVDVVTFRPLIQKSNRIPDDFFKAIQYNNRPFKEFDPSSKSKLITLNQQKYLPYFNPKIHQYKLFQSEKVDFTLNPQQIDKLMENFPFRQRQQANINLLRKKLRKML